MLAYPIKLAKDDNGTYLVTCPSLPEVTTYGEDIEDALRHAGDAIEEAIAARMAGREPIPAPSNGKYGVVLPALTVAKVLLYRRMLERSISKNALAKTLHWHRPQVDRLLDLRHGTRLDLIERALKALGAKMRIDLENDAR